jgi:hypothetical protein
MKIPSPWIQQEKIMFPNIRQFLSLSEESQETHESSVAWFDCSTSFFGRGVFIRGSHILSSKPFTQPPKAKLQLFSTPPFSLINRFTLDTLNSGYYQLHKLGRKKEVVNMWPFYYPLDSIGQWNRAYGPNGFYQYQCVVPAKNSQDALTELLARISSSGAGSFLAVLKSFGSIRSKGFLSFPMEGTTLALDFPNLGDKTKILFKELDSVVEAAGGRLNPSKDSLMSKSMFQSGYPMYTDFLKYRDPAISSGFSRRIMGS